MKHPDLRNFLKCRSSLDIFVVYHVEGRGLVSRDLDQLLHPPVDGLQPQPARLPGPRLHIQRVNDKG